MIDIQEKKNKIISFLKISGPSLPVRIARTIEMDPVFASAILSELLNEKKIKTSNLRIGSSPLYLIQGQEQKLENFTEHLKPIEQDILQKLKEQKTLDDEKQEPAHRVALRSIKDFAIPTNNEEKIIWQYAFSPKEEKPQPTATTSQLQNHTTSKPKVSIEPIFKPSRPHDATTSRLAKRSFLEKIEEFLKNQNTEIISMEEVDKKKVIAKIKSESQTAFLFAFNKKRITEDELMKCYKKAKTENLPYQIITLDEQTKKLNEKINAFKKLTKIETLKT